MTHEFTPRGVCSRKIFFDLEEGKLRNVRFVGGCSGNTQGIASLVEGMEAAEVVSRLQGISCGGKPTSCPDQLSRAIAKALEKEKRK